MSWPVWLRRGVSTVIIVGLVVSGYLYIHNQQYKLTDGELALLAKPSVDLKLVKETKDGFTYNHAAEQKVDGHSITTAASEADSTGKFPYEVTLPHNEGAGIKFSDSSGDLSFTMKPNFSSAAGRQKDGRVIYPEGLNSVHAYTFKRNGIKEDIILSKAPGSDTYTKSWTLNLGDKLEAKMLPNGGVGIYSADSMLFGNVQASDAKDQALIDKARKNGQKTNLAFVIPAPYVTYSSGQKDFQNVKFNLNNNLLTLTVQGMKGRSYPLSIDPTLVVTTTADFQAGTDDDGMIDWSTSGQINRGDISYGAASSVVQKTSAFLTARMGHTSIVYKGYLYIIGGYNGGYQNDIQYCPLNADGSVGSCTQQSSAFSSARRYHTSVVYNGYLYIVGGWDGAGYLNDIQYCPLNSNGSVGSCTQQTNAFTTARYGHSSVVYNGYLYIVGGFSGSYQNDIQYCPLNADGSVGSCTQQTNAFTTAREYHSSVVYNGYLYIVGGDGGGTNQNDIQYCPLNSNGSVGSCTQQTNAFTTARYVHTSVVYNGYLYIVGGFSGSYQNDIQYCPLNSNGSVGSCTQQTNFFITARGYHTSVAYNGYLYIVGGYNGSYQNDIQYGFLGKLGSVFSVSGGVSLPRSHFNNAATVYNGYLYVVGGQDANNTTGCDSLGRCNDVQYCPINSDGSLGACTQQLNAFTNGRYNLASVAANGYLYVLGGQFGNVNYYGDIQYCPLNTNGSVGTCTTSATSIGQRYGHNAVTYNGYLYVIGGYNGSFLNDIQYCQLNNNGDVSTCSSSTFTSGRWFPASAAYNGYLYISGGESNNGATGCNGSGDCGDIQYCPLNSNGSVGTCTQQLNAFTSPRYQHTSVAVNGYLYIIAGTDRSNVNYTDIQFCPINSNGSVGTCTLQQKGALIARNNFPVALNNGKIYLVGNNSSASSINILSIIGGTLGSVGSTTQQTSAFTTARWLHSSVVYNGYLYIIGGINSSSTYLNDIQYCPLNSNGSVGTCTQQTNAFTTPRSGQSSVAYNGYLYIVGGNGGGTLQNDIQYCPLNSNGSVGTCTQQTNKFTTARMQHSSIVYNGYLYIVGGYDGSSTCTNNVCNDIQYCPLNSNGSVGTCTQQTNAFTTGRYSHASVEYNGYLYIIGGNDGVSSTRLSDIQYCPINSNGSVGSCIDKNNAFTIGRSGLSSLVYNGNIFIIGGNLSNDIQYCPVNANGSVGACNQQVGAFTTPRDAQTAAVYNGYVYVIGGNASNGNPTGCTSASICSDIQYLKITDRGFSGVGASTDQTSAFTSARVGHASAVYNGYLYIVDGSPQLKDIQYCPLNNNGSVGTCTQQLNMISRYRTNHTVVTYNGYLYIIGGSSVASAPGCNASGYCNDIWYCPLNSNGSVGTCTQQTNAFTTARAGHTSVVYNGYIYIIGGSGGSYQNDIQYCPLNSNGSVGTCTQQTNAFTMARAYHTSVVNSGYLYVIGGSNGSLLSDIQYCPINSNGSVGACTQRSGAFTNARSQGTAVAYNGNLYVIGGLKDLSNIYGDIQYCPFLSNGSVGDCNQIGALSVARYSHASVVNNGYIYTIGGNDGSSNRNDIEYVKLSGPQWISHYERVFDTGSVAASFASFIYNGSTKCDAILTYKTADGTGIYGSATTIMNTLAGTSYTLNVANQRYLWISISMDDTKCGGTSNVTDMTLTYLNNPAAPTLNSPASSATSVALTPTFQMRTTDPNSDYLRYKIDVCSTSNCSSIVRTIDQTSSQTGWTGQDTQSSTAYIGSSVLTSSTMANYNYQLPALTAGTQYWWRAYAIDPGGDNVWSSASAIQSFTTSFIPAAPTLIAPASAATGVSSATSFQLRSTDADNDYLRYKIDICTTSNCSSILQTLDETSSQIGWGGQDTQSGTAYTGNSSIGNSTIATYSFSGPSLKSNTQYWWRAYAIDPGGSNTFSSASAIQSFTTAQNETFIKGGLNFGGGVHFGN